MRWCASFRKGGRDHADRSHGILQPDLCLRAVDRFLAEAAEAGVDGLIVVDLPPEADDELCIPALEGRPEFHPAGGAHHRRQASADGAQNSSPALSIMSPSPASPGQGADIAAVAHNVARIKAPRRCLSPSASAFSTPEQAARHRKRRPMAWLSGSALVDALCTKCLTGTQRATDLDRKVVLVGRRNSSRRN